MAENHPVGFQWVMEARELGAKIIHAYIGDGGYLGPVAGRE